jgi:hypothetical protein
MPWGKSRFGKFIWKSGKQEDERETLILFLSSCFSDLFIGLFGLAARV